MWREVGWFFLMMCSTVLFAKDTELRLYRPLTKTEHHAFATIVEKKFGECWQQSHLNKREDAWRCIAEKVVYDPCFVQRFGSHLNAICIASPWSKKALQITVAEPLDNGQHAMLDMSKTYPWALELTNGETCKAIESTDVFDGLPVRYRCSNHSELIGHVQRCNASWKMLQHSDKGVTTIDISKAWF